MRRLGGVEPALTLCPQPSRVRFLAGAASGPGSGRRRAVSSSHSPPRSASSPRPSPARAPPRTRATCGRAGLPGVLEPISPPSGADRAPRSRPPARSRLAGQRFAARAAAGASGQRLSQLGRCGAHTRAAARRPAAPGRGLDAGRTPASSARRCAAPLPLRSPLWRAKSNALKMPRGRNFAPKRRCDEVGCCCAAARARAHGKFCGH